MVDEATLEAGALEAGAARKPAPGTGTSAWLITGENAALLSEAVASLVNELIGPAERSLVLEDFAGEDLDVVAVAGACQTPPFLADRRVVVLRDAGRFNLDQLQPLLAYMEEPLPTTKLVVAGGGGTLPVKFVNAFKTGPGTALVNTDVSGREAHNWVGERIARAPLNLARGRGFDGSVGAERQSIDPFRMPTQSADLPTGLGIPELDRLVVTGGGQAASVGAERHRHSPGAVPAQGPDERPETASQSCTVLSAPPPVAMLRPSGLYATQMTWSDCPPDRINWPEPTSQILKVPSPMPAEATRRPSGLYATHATMPECPRRVRVLASQSRLR